MTVQRLPLEIVEKILEHVDRNDLEMFLFVCKRWHHLVKSLYFEKVYWRTEKIQWLKQYLRSLSKKSNDTQIFETKRLQIHYDVDHYSDSIFGNYTSFSTRFTEREFLYLLSRFPNLKCLDIKKSTHQMHYMEILCNCQPMKLPQLEEIITEIDITNHGDNDPRVLKFEACYQFRQTIKYMITVYTNALVCERGFMKSLVDFKRLSVLEIYNDANPDITLFHLLHACPSLSTLVYDSTFPIPYMAKQQLASMIKNSRDQQLSHSVFLKNLRKLKLSLPTFPTPYADFFRIHTPKSLDNVDIHITHMCMRSWILSETIDVSLDFCKSLQNFIFVSLKFKEEWDVDCQDIDSFYQTLNALTGNKNICTRSAKHKSRKDIPLTGGEVCIAGTDLYYEYCFDIESYLTIDDHDSGEPSHQNYNYHSTSTLKQLALIDQFNIWAEPREHEEHIIIPRHYFEYTKRFLPNITHFRLSCLFKDFFLEANCSTNYKSLQHMTHIKMNGSFSPQDVIMNDFPEYFPNVKVLTFGLQIPFKFRSERIQFKLANFKKLQTLDIDIEQIEHFKFGPVFLQYTNDSQQRTHYLLRNETINGKIMKHNNFEVISAKDMKEGVKQDFSKGYFTYAIIVEGSQQLKRIELRNNNRRYAEIDLESNM